MSADNDFLAVADIDSGDLDVVDADALEIVDNIFDIIFRVCDDSIESRGIVLLTCHIGVGGIDYGRI